MEERKVLSEKNGVQIARVEGDYPHYEVSDDGGTIEQYYDKYRCKEYNCMLALSQYLKSIGEIRNSYMELDGMFDRQTIPYSRLKEIAYGALTNLDDDTKKAVLSEMTRDEKEFLGVIDKPYVIKEYKATQTLTANVTIAVPEDADEYEIECALNDYIDDISSHRWSYEDCTYDEEYTGAEHYTAEEAEDEADTILYA